MVVAYFGELIQEVSYLFNLFISIVKSAFFEEHPAILKRKFVFLAYQHKFPINLRKGRGSIPVRLPNEKTLKR